MHPAVIFGRLPGGAWLLPVSCTPRGKSNRPDLAARVTIDHHVWVAAGAAILPGVSIGDGAVVAPSSVVTKDVAPFTIVAGNLARFIKNRELVNDGAV